MKLSIIIVNYNTGALTKMCVESLLKEGLPGNYEVIVVDNGSTDESVSFLRSDFPEITVIDAKENLGLAAGVNKAIRAARGEFYLILNPDIVVMPGAVPALLQFMNHNPKAGIAGGKLISPDGSLQYSCFRFYKLLTILYRRTFLGKLPAGKREVDSFLMKDFDHMTERSVDWLMGACLMVRAKAHTEVGGMDERFFLYFEDVDWCRRFWEHGWEVKYVPQAIFSHFHQRSSARMSILGVLTDRVARMHISSAIKYFAKYWGKPLPRSK